MTLTESKICDKKNEKLESSFEILNFKPTKGENILLSWKKRNTLVVTFVDNAKKMFGNW